MTNASELSGAILACLENGEGVPRHLKQEHVAGMLEKYVAAKLDSLTAENKRLRLEHADMGGDLDGAQDETDALTAERDAGRIMLKETHGMLEETRADLARCHDRLAEQQATLETMQYELVEAEGERDRALQQRANAQGEADRYREWLLCLHSERRGEKPGAANQAAAAVAQWIAAELLADELAAVDEQSSGAAWNPEPKLSVREVLDTLSRAYPYSREHAYNQGIHHAIRAVRDVLPWPVTTSDNATNRIVRAEQPHPAELADATNCDECHSLDSFGHSPCPRHTAASATKGT